jgi:hypothetical protein
MGPSYPYLLGSAYPRPICAQKIAAQVQLERGHAWLVSMFEKIGQDPDVAAYLKPSTDDVWEFLFSIKKWLTDPAPMGIPT